MSSENGDDPDLTEEQRRRVDELATAQVEAVDRILLSQARRSWRKVAMVVGKALRELETQDVPHLPDVYLAERVRLLVERGALESQGNLRRMRFSEVRLSQPRLVG